MRSTRRTTRRILPGEEVIDQGFQKRVIVPVGTGVWVLLGALADVDGRGLIDSQLIAQVHFLLDQPRYGGIFGQPLDLLLVGWVQDRGHCVPDLAIRTPSLLRREQGV